VQDLWQKNTWLKIQVMTAIFEVQKSQVIGI